MIKHIASGAAGVESANALIEAIESLAVIRDNWNGMGAPAPNASSIKNARRIAAAIDSYSLPFEPVSASPSSEGGIALSFRNRTRRAIIECYNSDEVLIGTVDGEEIDTFPVRVG